MLIRVASHLRVITTAKHFRSPALSYRNIQCIGNWKTTVGGNDGFEPSREDKLGKLNGTPQKPHALRRIPLACFCFRGGEGHCFRVNAVNMESAFCHGTDDRQKSCPDTNDADKSLVSDMIIRTERHPEKQK